MNLETADKSILPRKSANNAWLLALWFIMLTLGVAFTGYKVLGDNPFYHNLLDLLPQDKRNPVANELGQALSSRFEDRLLILLKHPDPEKALEHAQQLQHKLFKSPWVVPTASSAKIQKSLQALYHPYRLQLLNAATRQNLEQRSAAQLAQESYEELFTPAAIPRPLSFLDDPFNLSGQWFSNLPIGSPISLYKGFNTILDPENTQQRWFMITGQLLKDPFDLEVQKFSTELLHDFKNTNPSVQLLTSGLIFHTAAGSAQARSEISTVGLGSLLGIIALVCCVFRSGLPLLAVLITLACGTISALAVSLLLFDNIHMVTLAFGCTLLGVSVDYVFHFLISANRLNSGIKARHHLRSALTVGALSSISAYLLQLTTAFPGLQQMAVFSSAGLAGAWLTVLALAPYYRPPSHAAKPIVSSWLFRLCVLPISKAVQRLTTSRALLIGAVFLALGFSLWQSGANDGVRNLNTSPPALLENEHQVQQLLKQPSSSRYLLVKATTETELLHTLAQLQRKLTSVTEGKTQGRGLHQVLPSLEQQQSDHKLILDKLYQQTLPLLCAKLQTNCQPAIDKALSQDFQSLNYHAFNAPELAGLAPPAIQTQGQWQTLLSLSGDINHPALMKLVLDHDDVELVDQSEDISKLLSGYRVSISNILLLTIGLLTLTLSYRYRLDCWRLMVPLCLSLMFSLWAAAADGISMFHLMALLLVLGIGIDTSVFYLEVGLNRESWLASSLSSATSILAFGLLSLSGVEILKQFGAIVLSGIFFCWLVTPLFHRQKARVTHS